MEPCPTRDVSEFFSRKKFCVSITARFTPVLELRVRKFYFLFVAFEVALASSLGISSLDLAFLSIADGRGLWMGDTFYCVSTGDFTLFRRGGFRRSKTTGVAPAVAVILAFHYLLQ